MWAVDWALLNFFYNRYLFLKNSQYKLGCPITQDRDQLSILRSLSSNLPFRRPTVSLKLRSGLPLSAMRSQGTWAIQNPLEPDSVSAKIGSVTRSAKKFKEASVALTALIQFSHSAPRCEPPHTLSVSHVPRWRSSTSTRFSRRRKRTCPALIVTWRRTRSANRQEVPCIRCVKSWATLIESSEDQRSDQALVVTTLTT